MWIVNRIDGRPNFDVSEQLNLDTLNWTEKKREQFVLQNFNFEMNMHALLYGVVGSKNVK